MRLIGVHRVLSTTPALHHATPALHRVAQILPKCRSKSGLICIHWSADAQVGVIAGQWQRLADGRIEATYAPDELTTVLCIAGYDVTEESIRQEVY